MIKDVSEPVNCVFPGISIYITTKCTRILKITQLLRNATSSLLHAPTVGA